MPSSRRRSAAARQVLVLTAIAVLVGLASRARSRVQHDPIEPQPAEGLIASFDADVEDERTVRFRWSYASHAEGKMLDCALSYYAGQQEEERIPDCGKVTTHKYQYNKAGKHQASLLVRSRSGDRDLKTVEVEVE